MARGGGARVQPVELKLAVLLPSGDMLPQEASPDLRAAALRRRPRLACNTYDYAFFFAGSNGTLKAYMKKKSATILIMPLMMQMITQH